MSNTNLNAASWEMLKAIVEHNRDVSLRAQGGHFNGNAEINLSIEHMQQSGAGNDRTPVHADLESAIAEAYRQIKGTVIGPKGWVTDMLPFAIMSKFDADYVIYKGRKVLMCPRDGSRLFEVPVLYSNNDGYIRVSFEESIFGPRYIYSHLIVENGNSYHSYETPMTIGFEISLENLLIAFYPFYFRKEGKDILRCPAVSMDQAWEHSEPFNPSTD